jgi:hypothetical protein
LAAARVGAAFFGAAFFGAAFFGVGFLLAAFATAVGFGALRFDRAGVGFFDRAAALDRFGELFAPARATARFAAGLREGFLAEVFLPSFFFAMCVARERSTPADDAISTTA